MGKIEKNHDQRILMFIKRMIVYSAFNTIHDIRINKVYTLDKAIFLGDG